MSDLTAKWKAGELGHGTFYVRLFTGAVVVDVFDANPLRFTLYENDIDEVLAPVPNYDEYKAMQAELAEHQQYCCCSENEFMQLKLAEMEELLRECLAHLSLGEIGASVTSINILITRINAAINETQANPVDCNKIQESEER